MEAEPDAKPHSPAPSSPDLAGALQLALKTAGIAGVFAVVGYISLAAHEEFLGIRTGVNDVSQLSFAAAAFLRIGCIRPSIGAI
jgi:hypothetical protein